MSRFSLRTPAPKALLIHIGLFAVVFIVVFFILVRAEDGE